MCLVSETFEVQDAKGKRHSVSFAVQTQRHTDHRAITDLICKTWRLVPSVACDLWAHISWILPSGTDQAFAEAFHFRSFRTAWVGKRHSHSRGVPKVATSSRMRSFPISPQAYRASRSVYTVACYIHASNEPKDVFLHGLTTMLSGRDAILVHVSVLGCSSSCLQLY